MKNIPIGAQQLSNTVKSHLYYLEGGELQPVRNGNEKLSVINPNQSTMDQTDKVMQKYSDTQRLHKFCLIFVRITERQDSKDMLMFWKG